jgi:hypothetical protein
MPYPTRTNDVQYIQVVASINNQTIINVFWLKAANVNVQSGESDILLQNFINNYRANILFWMYDIYQVVYYVMQQAVGALQVAAGDPPKVKWIPEFDPLAVEQINGDTINDKGQVPSTGIEFMPVHDALRIRKRPRVRHRGYFRGAYNRFCQFPETKANALINEWDLNWVGLVANSVDIFNDTGMADLGAAPNVWEHAIYSATLFGRVFKPLGGPARDAAQRVDAYEPKLWIGTQTTRRYKPDGLRRGA